MSSSNPTRVLIIDDSAVVRETLKDLLSAEEDIEVMGTANDPFIAARKLEREIPDVITLDIEMPRMDGLTFLKKLMNRHPIPVVICSSQAGQGSRNALQALEYGAVEIIEKPKLGTKQFLEESRIRICDAVRGAAAAGKKAGPEKALASRPAPKHAADVILPGGVGGHVVETTQKIVVVGASTGGTEALRVLLQHLPADASGMVVVQHMPEHFTKAFAERLAELCEVDVKEAESNDSVFRGRALIAPGNRHTLLKRSGARYFVEVRDGPLVSRHRPSVDVLFRSAARYAGPNAVGVIMTGMGDDGARGMLELKQAGAYTLAQDEASSVVYGMPREAVARGAVDESISLQSMADAVLRVCGGRSGIAE